MQNHKYLVSGTVLVRRGKAIHNKIFKYLNEPGFLNQRVYQHDEFIGFASSHTKHRTTAGVKVCKCGHGKNLMCEAVASKFELAYNGRPCLNVANTSAGVTRLTIEAAICWLRLRCGA